MAVLSGLSDSSADAIGGAADERIYQAVFDSVMSQRLPPGTKLPEAALCEMFDTTRSVLADRRAVRAARQRQLRA